jgi:hypothetical protein
MLEEPDMHASVARELHCDKKMQRPGLHALMSAHNASFKLPGGEDDGRVLSE